MCSDTMCRTKCGRYFNINSLASELNWVCLSMGMVMRGEAAKTGQYGVSRYVRDRLAISIRCKNMGPVQGRSWIKAVVEGLYAF